MKQTLSIFIITSLVLSVINGIYGQEQQEQHQQEQTSSGLLQCAAWMKEMNPLVPMDFYIMNCYYVFEVEGKYPNVMTEEDRLKTQEKINKLVNISEIMNY
jgi:hypothetical protein